MTTIIKAEDLNNAIESANEKRNRFMNEFFSKKFKNLFVYTDIYDNGIRAFGTGLNSFISWLNKKRLGYETITNSEGETEVFWYDWSTLIDNK